jgi:arginyl-tRNA synthetase
MNIFEEHLSEIRKIIVSEKDSLKLEDIDNLRGVNLEIPPEQFNFDLSCNIAMVLGKKNKINPKTLALKLKDIFISKINNFSEIDIAGPGFLNI